MPIINGRRVVQWDNITAHTLEDAMKLVAHKLTLYATLPKPFEFDQLILLTKHPNAKKKVYAHPDCKFLFVVKETQTLFGTYCNVRLYKE